MKLLMDQIAMDVMYNKYKMTKEVEGPGVPIKRIEEFEMELNNPLQLICNPLLEKLKLLLERVVCQGYLVIDRFYQEKHDEREEEEEEEEEDETKHGSCLELLQSLKHKNGREHIIHPDGWKSIEDFLKKMVAGPSYKVYLLYKKNGTFEEPLKPEKQFAVDLRSAGLLPSFHLNRAKREYSKFIELLQVLICQGYVSIDRFCRESEQYEEEEAFCVFPRVSLHKVQAIQPLEEGEVLEEEDEIIAEEKQKGSLNISDKRSSSNNKRSRKEKETISNLPAKEDLEIENELDAGLQDALNDRSQIGSLMRDLKTAWKTEDLLHRKRFKKIEGLLRSAVKDGPVVSKKTLGQLTTHLKILACESYLDISKYYREQKQ
jgi:hypothetical protein